MLICIIFTVKMYYLTVSFRYHKPFYISYEVFIENHSYVYSFYMHLRIKMKLVSSPNLGKREISYRLMN